ncbi:branched-chain amino acid ABC transporter permease [Nocardioides eburneiflavus]|uniref:Branched-chain amino acid ABC transporter permease n=1 Tax=Nocardioides eburneiflavus TaxID=2518372 RepID=A0A4Z1CMQ8_9ACTN|nr:branched-chain amino acid ABC transporter permease [Nocardioides eburneiflavus]TGN65519.1 branched-chain amino acid ABC transporter permease [Nocardioides eburneiflavus]
MSKFKLSLTGLPKPVKIVFWLLLVAFAYALPLLELPLITTPGVDFGGVLFVVTMYMLVALGLNIVVGYAGLLDLGYVGFYAVGAYTAAILTSFHANWPLLFALPIAVLASTISGVLLGAPTLRVRGDYLAIVTLGFGEIIRLVAVNTEWLGEAKGISNIARPPSLGGTDGLFEIPHLYWGDGTVLLDTQDTTKFLVFGVLDQIPYYWLGLTVVIIILFADVLIKNSRVGRAWEATREDEDAAELMGVPTFRFKLLAFATGAFIGGLAGALYASRQNFINPQSFLLLFSILFLAAVVVGGQGNRWGVLVGAALVAYLPQRFREFDDFRVLVFGLALVVLATLRPEGLFPPKRTVRAKHLEQELEVLEEGGAEGEEGARV